MTTEPSTAEGETTAVGVTTAEGVTTAQEVISADEMIGAAAGPRFIVCGETLIDLVPAGPATSPSASTWLALSAGGPMNTAVALGRLGADSHFLGRLSDDAFGSQLRNHITSAGVHLDLATASSRPTSLAVVSLNDDGAASYTFHFDQTANFGWQADDLPNLHPQDWVHIASLACVVNPGAPVLLDWLSRTQASISYDINVRPTVITDPAVYWDRVRPWLRTVGQHRGIVKASDEDVMFLAAADTDAATVGSSERASGAGPAVVDPVAVDPVAVLTDWTKRYGFALGILTQGAGGAVAIEASGKTTAVAGFPTTVADTVGAGDTFMAGFLDGHVRLGHNLRTSLTRAAAAAAIVCSRQGAQPPTADEVDALISRG